MTQKALTPGRPTRQLPADNGQPHRFGRWIAPAVLAMLVLAIILTAGLQAPPPAEAQADTTVPLNWDLTPSGLVAGNQFRLIFVTHAGHTPTSTDIATYNTYVQGQANASNAHPAIKQYSSGFTVVGSTDETTTPATTPRLPTPTPTWASPSTG